MKLVLCIAFLAMSFLAMALERPVMNKQLKIVELNASISSAGVDSGFDKFNIAASKTATGTYAIAHSDVPFVMDSISHVTPIEAACQVKTITEGKLSTTVVMAAADGSTEKDCAFNIKLIGSLSDTYYKD